MKAAIVTFNKPLTSEDDNPCGLPYQRSFESTFMHILNVQPRLRGLR